jgi:hypothetical protein
MQLNLFHGLLDVPSPSPPAPPKPKKKGHYKHNNQQQQQQIKTSRAAELQILGKKKEEYGW